MVQVTAVPPWGRASTRAKQTQVLHEPNKALPKIFILSLPSRCALSFSYLNPLARRKILANHVNGNYHLDFALMPNDRPLVIGKNREPLNQSEMLRVYW